MKTFAELSVNLNGLSPEEFGELAEAVASDGWRRDRSKDEEMKRTGGAWMTFSLTGHPNLPPAFLFLTHKADADKFNVTNIISPARDRLTYDEYNEILKSFSDAVLARVSAQRTIDFDLGGMDVDLAAQLPQDVYSRLRLFSVAANKRTGSSHPLDQERWMDFLIASDKATVSLDSHILARWLVEVEGWESELASRLAQEYEFGRELLQRRRAS
jgi:hypothetical protein